MHTQVCRKIGQKLRQSPAEQAEHVLISVYERPVTPRAPSAGGSGASAEDFDEGGLDGGFHPAGERGFVDYAGREGYMDAWEGRWFQSDRSMASSFRAGRRVDEDRRRRCGTTTLAFAVGLGRRHRSPQMCIDEHMP